MTVVTCVFSLDQLLRKNVSERIGSGPEDSKPIKVVYQLVNNYSCSNQYNVSQ